MKLLAFSTIFLLFFSAKIIFASEIYHPTAQQLELTFGIEEELRSGLAKKIFLAGPTLSPILLHATSSLDTYMLTVMDIYIGTLSPMLGAAMTEKIHTKKQKTFATHILDECKKIGKFTCIQESNPLFLGKTEYKIIFQDPLTHEKVGHLVIGRDPMVIEVAANPFKIKDTEGAMGEILENSLYKISKKSGLHSATLGGETHLHIDFKSLFGGGEKNPIDYRFFRNYIVDWANHNELYYGAFHYDATLSMAANPLLDTMEKRVTFQKWLLEYDSYLKNKIMTPGLFNAMREKLAKECGFQKGAALNVKPRTFARGSLKQGFKDASLGTLEIRSSRPNKNLSELTRKLTILQARANYIKAQQELIPYYNSAAIQSAQEGVNRFGLYLSESKLDWDEYKKVLPKTWQKKTPQAIPIEEMFAAGKLQPPTCFKAFTHLMIHVFRR